MLRVCESNTEFELGRLPGARAAYRRLALSSSSTHLGGWTCVSLRLFTPLLTSPAQETPPPEVITSQLPCWGPCVEPHFSLSSACKYRFFSVSSAFLCGPLPALRLRQ